MLKVINEGKVVAKVNINGKFYDVKTGKPIAAPVVARKPAIENRPIKNNRRTARTSNAASRATFVKPVVVAKPKPKSVDGLVPPAATKPNPIKNAAKKDPPKKDLKSQRRKLLQGAIIAVIVVVGFGLLALFYFPTFSVNFAASQAGLSRVSVPSFVVEGYSMDGAVQVENRTIIINYRNADGEIYSISQQNSNWDSEGLLENKIILGQLNYQVLTQRGLTIYRLDDGATWVNGGILFTISNAQQLSNEQILNIIAGV